MSQTPSKKPGVREMRVSDWMRLKAPESGETSSDRPGHEPSRDIPIASIMRNNGGEAAAASPRAQASTGTTTPVQRQAPIQPARTTPVFPARMLGSFLPQSAAPSVPEAPPVTPSTPAADAIHGQPQPLPFDPFRYLGGLLQRKKWIFVWSSLALMLGFLVGVRRGDTYSASAVLMFRDVPTSVSVEGGHGAYKPKNFDAPTLTAILTTEPLLQRVVPHLKPPTTARMFSLLCDVEQERGADYVRVTYRGAPSAQAAVDGVNLWADQAVEYTKHVESKQTTESRAYLQRQSLVDAVSTAKTELSGLQAKYSDENPIIREKKAQVEWLDQKIRDYDAGIEAAGKQDYHSNSERNLVGYFSVIAPATLESVGSKSRWMKGGVFGLAGFFGGLLMTIGFVLTREAFDLRVRTVRELELATGARSVQRISQVQPDAIGTAEVASLWTRVVAASPAEIVCYWMPCPHEQAYFVSEALLNLASKHNIPLIWVNTEISDIQAPADFSPIEVSDLSRQLAPTRYVLNLALNSMTAVDAGRTAVILAEAAARQRMPVWLAVRGDVLEPSVSLVRRAHRIKIMAALGAEKRSFWRNQAELLRQGFTNPIEWLAVNYIPWYRW